MLNCPFHITLKRKQTQYEQLNGTIQVILGGGDHICRMVEQMKNNALSGMSCLQDSDRPQILMTNIFSNWKRWPSQARWAVLIALFRPIGPDGTLCAIKITLYWDVFSTCSQDTGKLSKFLRSWKSLSSKIQKRRKKKKMVIVHSNTVGKDTVFEKSFTPLKHP